MKNTRHSSIDASLRAALERAPSELLERAAEDVRARPYLFVDLSCSRRASAPPSLVALSGVVTLRLWLVHHALHPWLVAPEDASEAKRLLPRLLADEQELLRASLEAGAPPRVELAYATLLALHPIPTDAIGADANGPPSDALATLVDRWEDEHRRPRSLAAVLREKLRQHALFYRAFFFAPAYLLRRQRVRALLPPIVAEHPMMRETFSAIEQLGPVLDNFVFAGRGAAMRPRAVAIADFAFLYMQLADEVVDSIFHAAGAEAALALVDRLYPEAARERDLAPFWNLDAEALRSVGLDRSLPVPKYATTLGGMIDALSALRAAIEACIDALRGDRREAIRAGVRGFFHHCFGTFLDELHLPRLSGRASLDTLPLEATQWHTYRKNNLVMMRFVALRMALLGLRPEARLPELRAWGYVLASFQVFDDLKDVWVDLGKQPSYPLQVAATRFPEEYAALERAFPGERRGIDRDEPPRLSMRVPKTVLTCLRLARLMGLAHFDWFTFYVADYRWRRNWLLRARSFNSAPERPTAARERAPVLHTVLAVLAATEPLRRHLAAEARAEGPESTRGGRTTRSAEEYLAYVLDVVGYDHLGAVLRAALPDLRLAYRFVNLRMRMTAREKAALLRRLVRRHRAALEHVRPAGLDAEVAALLFEEDELRVGGRQEDLAPEP
jgi:hypothetical protein